jgi:hypothetical protein
MAKGQGVLGQGLLLPNQWTLKKGEAPPRPLPPFALAKARGRPKQKGSSDKGCFLPIKGWQPKNKKQKQRAVANPQPFYIKSAFYIKRQRLNKTILSPASFT